MSHPQEHGTIESYMIGFAASLAFTLIPYYLVRHAHEGSARLLVAIMGLAVIQLIIQIVFFLHLGRGPKARWELYFFYATASMILVVVGGSMIIVNNLHHNMGVVDQTKKLVNSEAIYQVDGKLTGACQQTHTNYKVMFKHSTFTPAHITANKCDTLTFMNQDGGSLDIVFGSSVASETYGGESDINLRADQPYDTITLSESGNFHFYDRQHPQYSGSFLVTDDNQAY